MGTKTEKNVNLKKVARDTANRERNETNRADLSALGIVSSKRPSKALRDFKRQGLTQNPDKSRATDTPRKLSARERAQLAKGTK
jgi:hypothetical protein